MTPFDFHGTDWNASDGDIMSTSVQVSKRFFWLCGEPYPKLLGGQVGAPRNECLLGLQCQVAMGLGFSSTSRVLYLLRM